MAEPRRPGPAAGAVLRLVSILVPVLGLSLALAGCAGGEASGGGGDGSALPPAEGDTAERPPRIVSLAPSHTEILFALGAGGDVVAVTVEDDHPPAVAELPRVGGMTSDTLDLERVLAARPTVVIALAHDQQEAVAALRRLEVEVEVIPAESLADLFEAVRRLGAITGREEAAEELAGRLRQRVEAVRRAVAGVPEGRRPRVFYEVWDRPLMTAGPETFVSELIETAGGRNVFADAGTLYPRVSPEAVIRRDPEVILAPDRHGEPVSAGELARRPGWEVISAVRRGRVHTVDGDLVSRPGPRLVEALETVARLLHPERFPGSPDGAGGAADEGTGR